MQIVPMIAGYLKHKDAVSPLLGRSLLLGNICMYRVLIHMYPYVGMVFQLRSHLIERLAHICPDCCVHGGFCIVHSAA